MELNKLYNQDCLIGMKALPDKSIDLIVIDPPYNIGKDKRWDKWKTVKAYVEFMGQVFKECERVLKDNGSFYFFHNDFMQIVELQNYINQNTKFIFKQFLTWDKFNGSKWNQLNAIVYSNDNRNYSKQAEYILYYTFQDETGLTTVMLDTNNFPTMRGYFKDLQEYIDLGLKQINNKLGHRRAEHSFYWKTTQWDMPTEETYNELIKVFSIDRWQGYKEYESLRQEYESLRYTFNNPSVSSVLLHEPIKQNGHITPKPIPIMETLIKTSSNENDVVLDCFMGSGTTAIACINTNRNYIGYENNEEYYNISQERIQKHKAQIQFKL